MEDFMFACAMYPSDRAFMKSITAEAIAQVKRLRNHPSIVLWCGNNELETGWQNWGGCTCPHSAPVWTRRGCGDAGAAAD